jgi:hypothetical protein
VYTAVVGGLAVLVIGIACAVCYPIARDELERVRTARGALAAGPDAAAQTGGSAPESDRAAADGSDPGELRTRLAILRTDKADGAKMVVALGRPSGPKTTNVLKDAKQATLLRELVRQALLIAARDELGLSTRDEVLEDGAFEPGESEPAELATLIGAAHTRAVIRRGEAGKSELLLKLDLGEKPRELSFSGRLAVQAELYSRTEFPAALRKLGASGDSNKVHANAPVAADVEQRLASLSLVDTYAAVRALHEAIRSDGESPARLAALARGYAQLGALTEYQWSPADRVFKARAMLYAERLRARDPQSAWAIWNRAFVWTLVGLHSGALDDLDQAKARAADKKDGATAPTWVPVLDAYLKNDPGRLTSKDGPNAKLSALLKMMSFEYPRYTRSAVLAARGVLNLDSDCYRAYDVICTNGELRDLHFATTRGPDAFTALLPIKLKSLKPLPATVRQPLENNMDELALLTALKQAGRAGQDTGEPSWGVLAQLASEVRFVQVWRRLAFMIQKWSVPVDDYWADVKPSVARHRFYKYVESLTLPPREAREAIAKLADGFDPTDVETKEEPLTDQIRDAGFPIGQILWAFCCVHCESGAADIASIIAGSNKKVETAHVLLKLSPYSAFAMATLVEHDWNNVKGDIAGWREKVHDNPALLAALGKKYSELKQFDQAEEHLARYVELSSDRWAYDALAACYLARGDHARWRTTLDNYLTKTEDAGLEHAKVRVAIADDLMKDGRYAEAWPYAEAAAQTWAGWAMTCAQNCAEGLEKWDTAEGYARASSERYPGSMWAVWFLFCERTGHGDLAAARAFTKDFSSELLKNPDLSTDSLLLVSYVQLLCGDKANAAAALRRMPKDTSEQIYIISMAATGDLAGAPEVRDAGLERFCTSFKTSAPNTTQVFQLIRDAIAAKKPGELDLKAIDGIFEKVPIAGTAGAAFVVAGHLMANGHKDLAKRYWQRASHQENPSFWWRVFALSILRQHYPNQADDDTGPREV